MSGMLATRLYPITRKKQSDPRVRICTAATAFGNTGFMGIPLLEALLPEYPEAVAFASAFFIAMNLLMWTVGSAIITRDRKYVRLKKVLVRIRRAPRVCLFNDPVLRESENHGAVEYVHRDGFEKRARCRVC